MTSGGVAVGLPIAAAAVDAAAANALASTESVSQSIAAVDLMHRSSPELGLTERLLAVEH
ncbi:hypothetical protein O9993_02350 [Vibrio lentus]|nr:hypothetical protein [Vibrio lentus]